MLTQDLHKKPVVESGIREILVVMTCTICVQDVMDMGYDEFMKVPNRRLKQTNERRCQDLYINVFD